VFWILFILGWIICSVIGYFVFRCACKRTGYVWTISDRRCGIFIGLLLGPLAIIAGLLEIWLDDNDTPAKW